MDLSFRRGYYEALLLCQERGEDTPPQPPPPPPPTHPFHPWNDVGLWGNCPRQEKKEEGRGGGGSTNIAATASFRFRQFLCARTSYPTNSALSINFRRSSDAEIFCRQAPTAHANRRQACRDVHATRTCSNRACVSHATTGGWVPFAPFSCRDSCPSQNIHCSRRCPPQPRPSRRTYTPSPTSNALFCSPPPPSLPALFFSWEPSLFRSCTTNEIFFVCVCEENGFFFSNEVFSYKRKGQLLLQAFQRSGWVLHQENMTGFFFNF